MTKRKTRTASDIGATMANSQATILLGILDGTKPVSMVDMVFIFDETVWGCKYWFNIKNSGKLTSPARAWLKTALRSYIKTL